MKGAKVNVRSGSYEKKRITDGGGRGSQKRNSLKEIDGETVETVSGFIFGGSKITADGDLQP